MTRIKRTVELHQLEDAERIEARVGLLRARLHVGPYRPDSTCGTLPFHKPRTPGN